MGGGGLLHDFASQCMAGGLQVLSLFIGLCAESLAYVPHDTVLYNVLTGLLCSEHPTTQRGKVSQSLSYVTRHWPSLCVRMHGQARFPCNASVHRIDEL
jgi:hypothetical protein